MKKNIPKTISKKIIRHDSIYPLKKIKKNNLPFTFIPTELANLIMEFYGIAQTWIKS